MRTAWHKVNDKPGDVLNAYIQVFIYAMYLLYATASASSVGCVLCMLEVVGSIHVVGIYLYSPRMALAINMTAKRV